MEEKETKVKLFVLYNGYATVEGFHEYLMTKIPRSAGNFTVIHKASNLSDGSTEFEVEFESKNKAKQSLARLRKVEELRVSLAAASFAQSLQLEVNDFILSLQRSRGTLLVSREDEINKLELKRKTLPKHCKLDEYEEISSQQKAIKQQIEEYTLQSKEFDAYCTEILTELKCILTSDQLNVKSTEERVIKLQAKFGIECQKFTKALPMYARRKSILSTIAEHQVSILIGETGSGKSTQLVQYLYDAGIVSGGIIACTQPRKVAAVSLANHVSREMCVKVGEELGYKTGISGKYSDRTKVIYMTDHTLLNECIEDKNFTKYSCLVIDEAHERNLHTDLLLSFVKKCLPNRKDLRVIITSATIDPKIFVEYFGDECPVIRVPGRAYPVETIWRPIQSVAETPTADEYISAAIEMIDIIHRTDGPGDILVFLTSPSEVENACQLLSENLDGNSSIALPLHGKMQPLDQQKVFQAYEGKRKVIFCTNVAETSVTIDGVKFVIDTGMAKELRFDPKRNMNSLDVCRISKSSAEQRKGRAGRTSPGKCFRLYDQEVYDKMRDRMLPELLRTHLTLAVLKLYEFGVEDVLKFDFVEQPDPGTLREAVKILRFVDAIDDSGLTDRGKVLATLPIDPQLGKVLLDGIEAGVGLEAAIVVAMSTVGGGVFFRAGTEAEKAASDKKKLQFCHEAGDQMSCLYVYCKWMSQHKEARNGWCFSNSINAKSMRRVEETIKELQKTLQTHNKKIMTTLKDIKNAEVCLPRIFFFSFLNNIAVFTGHERAGYILSEDQSDPSFIFPGSVLPSQNLVPRYIVYEKVLKTSRQFLLQVMPVKSEWIDEAVSNGKLPLDPAERFKEYMVSAVSLTHIGWQLFKKAYIDNDKVKQELKETCQNTPHSTDTSITKTCGIIKVYSQPRYHGQIRSMLEKRFNEMRNKLMREQHVVGVTAENDDVQLVLGHGGQIQYVLMPGDSMTIVVKGPLNTRWTTSVLEELNCLADISSSSARSLKKEHRLYVTFYDPKDAANAMAVLSEQHGVDEDNITVEHGKRHMGGQYGATLKVEWCRRMRKKFAFIEFENQWDATRILLYSHPKYKFKPNKNPDQTDHSFKVFVLNVPDTHTEEDIENVVDSRLSVDSVAPNLGFKVQLGYEKQFTTSPEKLHHLKHQLKMLIGKYTQPNKYKLEMPVPKDFHKTYRAYVNITDVAESHKILDGLVNETIDGHSLTIKPQLSSFVLFPNKVFTAIKKDIARVEAVLKQCYGNVLSIKKTDNNINIKYELKSEYMQAYIDAKQMLNSTMVPAIKDCRSQPILRQFVLSSCCQEIMNDIQQKTSTVILINKWSLTISVYGTEESKTEAIQMIERHLDQLLQSDIKNYDIPLKQPGRPPGLMKHVVSQFGLDLEKMVQKEGISGAVLNVHKHVLSVNATDDAYKSLLKEIDSFTPPNANHPAQNEEETVECCVCWMQLDSESEVFRLEFCGHSYCTECIQIQVTSSTTVFPLVCAADQCSQQMVIQDFLALCRRVSFTMQQLCEASLRSYILANPDKVKNCYTPDCKMIYAVSEVGERFCCGLCGVSICTKCHVQYHDNLTCAMYQSLKREDSDIQKWIMEDTERRKCCPNCHVGIEKVAGCNHVSCRCGVNICWVCLEYFKDSQSCYAHLQTSHGSFI